MFLLGCPTEFFLTGEQGMTRQTTSSAEEMKRLQDRGLKQNEFEARAKAFNEDVGRISEFLPEATVRKYINE